MFSFWVSRTCCVQHCPIRWSQRWEEMSAVYWTPCGWLTSCWCSCLRGEKRCQSPQQGQRAGSQGCDVWTVLGRDHTDSSSTVSVARTQMLSSMPLTLEVMMQTNKYYRSHEWVLIVWKNFITLPFNLVIISARLLYICICITKKIIELGFKVGSKSIGFKCIDRLNFSEIS